jgi:isoleucyl-tRNA synthetase
MNKEKNTPHTDFPQRARAGVREPMYQTWEFLSPTSPTFVVHDGPPYANGKVHVGHALNKTLKDMAVRYRRGQGERVEFRPGFDCHGLPTELKMLQELTEEERDTLSPLELRRRCRAYAAKAVSDQVEAFKRLGVSADWDNPYLTMSPAYEARELEAVALLLEKGLLFRGDRTVWWSESSQSVLANAELEYREDGTPVDWRTGEPVEERSMRQWFLDLTKMQDLDEVEKVDWGASKKRFLSTMSDRKEWCVSRQRIWGLPIPAFYHKDTGEALMTPETVRHFANLVASNPNGSDAWWELPVEELLPQEYESADYVKGNDTFDVWLDSGLSWFANFGEGQVDLCWEGSDQHRGWFQSSFLTGVGLQGRAPFKTCLSHGFVLDGEGNKMSKSKGNTLDPLEFANEFGADTLRLWVAAGDYNQDLRASQGSLDQAKGDYRKLRGLLRFCLANLFDFNFDVYQGHHPLVQEVAEYKSNVNKAYERYEFNKAYRLTMDFVAHVSSAYLGSETEGMKGDLYLAYEGDHSNPLRREAQAALSYLLLTLLQTLEPMTPHLVSEVQAFQTFTVPQKNLSLRDLKERVLSYFEVLKVQDLKKSGRFRCVFEVELPVFDFRRRSTWEIIYRRCLGVLPGEEHITGDGHINGIYFRPWEVFGLDPKTASEKDLRKAYWQLAEYYHPDNPHTGDRRIFERIENMYQSLLARF